MRKLLFLGLVMVFMVGIISCETTQSTVDTSGKAKEECPLKQMGVACKGDSGKPCPISEGKGPCDDCKTEAANLQKKSGVCTGHDGKPCPNADGKGSCAECTKSSAQPDKDMMGMMKKQQELMADFERMNEEATKYLVAKNYSKALETLKALEAKFPPSSLVTYNMACVYSLSGDIKSAVSALRRSIQSGWFDWKHMDVDTDLDNIRNDGEYKKLRVALESIYPELPAMNESDCKDCPAQCK